MIKAKWKKGNGAGKRIAGIMLAAVVGFTGIVPAAGAVLPAESAEANAATKSAVQADIDATSYLKTGSRAVVKWTKVKGCDGYKVSRRVKGDWKTIKVVKSAKTTKIKQSDLEKKKTYKYKVESLDKVAGETVTTASDTTSVYVPKKLTQKTRTYKKTNQAKVIKLAKSKLGHRYVWGAEGPNVFDCSGFVYWVMKNSKVAGVKIYRYTAQGIYNHYGRYSIGRSISKAQPGDIVLFGRGRSKHSIYHAAIYYGNGKVIHASTGWGGGKKVKITKADTAHIAVIIRMPGLK